MFFRDYTLRYAAVLFLLALFLLVTGLLIYALWFSPPLEPPRRSRPVAQNLHAELNHSHFKGGDRDDNGSKGDRIGGRI